MGRRVPIRPQPASGGDRLSLEDEAILVHALFGSGLVLVRSLGHWNAECEVEGAGEGRLRLAYQTPGRGERIAQVLDQAGYRYVREEGALLVTGRAPPVLLQFDLPLRLETLNPQIRLHWAVKHRKLLKLAQVMAAVVPAGQRPRDPLEGIEVEIERHSTREPDQENLQSCSKWLLDIMQPFNAKTRPYGLGWIRSDGPKCLKACRVRHVQTREILTTVRICRPLPPNARIAT